MTVTLGRIAVAFSAFGCFCLCPAETRWCRITGRLNGDVPNYPVIARAAHESGPVIGRLIYRPSGSVMRLEPISGPTFLTKSLGDQVTRWTVSTDAQGEALCQSLLIVTFTIGNEAHPAYVEDSTLPSIYRVVVHLELPVIYDQVGTYTNRQ